MRIELTLLGRLSCKAGGNDLDGLSAKPTRAALLVYLAVERNATREALRNVLWSERTDDRARSALKQNLYELRRMLGSDWLIDEGDSVRVSLAVTTDFSAFTCAVDTGRWRDALALYQREFLAGFSPPRGWPFQFWLDTTRARASRLQRIARRNYLSDLLRLGDLQTALEAARQWTLLDPLEDEAHHTLIELSLRVAGRAEALRQYAAYERVLRQDGLAPLEETRELAGMIQRDDLKMRPDGSIEGLCRPRVDGGITPALAMLTERVA